MSHITDLDSHTDDAPCELPADVDPPDGWPPRHGHSAEPEPPAADSPPGAGS